jgi:hypothetical protein
MQVYRALSVLGHHPNIHHLTKVFLFLFQSATHLSTVVARFFSKYTCLLISLNESVCICHVKVSLRDRQVSLVPQFVKVF